MKKNVVIGMQSRTGSSLVASVFRAHGWHTGGDKVRSRDYVTHENQRIKSHLVNTYGSNGARPYETKDGGPDEKLAWIMRQEFSGRPWAWKGDLYYIPIFAATFPDLAFTYVQREIEAAIRSGLKGRTWPQQQDGRLISYDEGVARLRGVLLTKYALMEEWCSGIYPGIIVHTSPVRGGDFFSIRAAIENAGETFSEAATARAIRGINFEGGK